LALAAPIAMAHTSARLAITSVCLDRALGTQRM
jgi:hypothetical protein